MHVLPRKEDVGKERVEVRRSVSLEEAELRR